MEQEVHKKKKVEIYSKKKIVVKGRTKLNTVLHFKVEVEHKQFNIDVK